MGGNLGNTSLRCKKRNEDSMHEFDRLPQELRTWISTAELPWRPKSVRKTFDRMLSQTGSFEKAIEELNKVQQRLVSKDSKKVWGKEYPNAGWTIEN